MNRDEAEEMDEMEEALARARGRATHVTAERDRLRADLSAALAERDRLATEVAEAREQRDAVMRRFAEHVIDNSGVVDWHPHLRDSAVRGCARALFDDDTADRLFPRPAAPGGPTT